MGTFYGNRTTREGRPHRVLIEPSLAIHARHFASSIGRLSRARQMESYPKFHNEVGVPIVRIGCREFKCIGDKPPQDHPHIYLKMGDASEIVCPLLLYAIPLRSELGRTRS